MNGLTPQAIGYGGTASLPEPRQLARRAAPGPSALQSFTKCCARAFASDAMKIVLGSMMFAGLMTVLFVPGIGIPIGLGLICASLALNGISMALATKRQYADESFVDRADDPDGAEAIARDFALFLLGPVYAGMLIVSGLHALLDYITSCGGCCDDDYDD